MPTSYYLRIYWAVFKLNRADMLTDRQNMEGPICINFMHNNENTETVIRMLITTMSFLFPVKLLRGIHLMKMLLSMKMREKIPKVSSLSFGRHAHIQILATGEETAFSTNGTLPQILNSSLPEDVRCINA